MREIVQAIVDWVVDNWRWMVTWVVIVFANLLSACQLSVGATVGVTRTAEQSSTETTKTTITRNPYKEDIKDENPTH